MGFVAEPRNRRSRGTVSQKCGARVAQGHHLSCCTPTVSSPALLAAIAAPFRDASLVGGIMIGGGAASLVSLRERRPLATTGLREQASPRAAYVALAARPRRKGCVSAHLVGCESNSPAAVAAATTTQPCSV